MADLGLLTNTMQCGMSTVGTQALDANNDGAGMILYAPKTGNISHVYVPWGTKTGTASTYRIGVETGTTTRVPDGTYLGSGNAYLDVANPTASTLQRVALGASAAVTAGSVYWATVRYQTGTIDASHFINVSTFHQGIGHNLVQIPGAATLTAGTWAAIGGMSAWAVEYDDGTIVGNPFALNANQSWGSGTSPLYRGTKWTPGATVTSDQLFLAARISSAGADVNVHIMEGANATPVKTILIDQDVGGSPGNPGVWHLPTGTLTYTAGTVYRFLLEPTTATAITTFLRMRFYDHAAALAVGGGALGFSTSTALGTYTDTDDDFATIMPIVRGVTVSSGGGVGVIGG